MTRAEREAYRRGQRMILDELGSILMQGNAGAATHTIIGRWRRERLWELHQEAQRDGDEPSVRA